MRIELKKNNKDFETKVVSYLVFSLLLIVLDQKSILYQGKRKTKNKQHNFFLKKKQKIKAQGYYELETKRFKTNEDSILHSPRRSIRIELRKKALVL